MCAYILALDIIDDVVQSYVINREFTRTKTKQTNRSQGRGHTGYNDLGTNSNSLKRKLHVSEILFFSFFLTDV